MDSIFPKGHANKRAGSKAGLFKQPLGLVLNHVMEWAIGFFYGHVPEGYRVGHVEVHHGEGNGHLDVTTTLHVDRSTSIGFLRYLADFAEYWSGLTVVEYFSQKVAATDYKPNAKDYSDRRCMFAGMIAYYG